MRSKAWRRKWIPTFQGVVSSSVCGHSQVVRQWLPKPPFAGSSPVARSINRPERRHTTAFVFFPPFSAKHFHLIDINPSAWQATHAYGPFVFGNGFLDILAARFRQSGKRTADVSDFCLPEHQGLVHPLARAVELDESSMVDHPVDHRGGKLVVSQDRSPFAELDVGGEHHASLLVAC